MTVAAYAAAAAASAKAAFFKTTAALPLALRLALTSSSAVDRDAPESRKV